MEQKLEIEYKTLLSQNHAATLLAMGTFSFLTKQENIYYDTTDAFFQSLDIVLRIRKKNSEYLFTAKEKAKEGLKETEFFIDQPSPNHPKIHSYTKQFKENLVLQPFGSSITYRYIYDDEYGQWCLDFNVFEYTSDVELEYELHQGIANKKEHYLKQLALWNIPYQPCNSKFSRMLDQKKD